MASQTISATEFKAKCLEILDRVSNGAMERVTVTKRGKPVAVVVPPPSDVIDTSTLFGFMRGTVIISEDVDLAAPLIDEPLDAERGILHR